MPGKPHPWHTFTILGTPRKVRMVREYDGQRGSVWRDYQNDRGQVICVQAKVPGGRRKVAGARTARTAANKFAGK
jgi:hypothetical protein